MKIRKFLALSAAAALLPLAAPALAQGALRVGATVTDPRAARSARSPRSTAPI